MMPGGAPSTPHSRGRFTSYLKALPGPTMFQIPKWEKPGMWREKTVSSLSQWLSHQWSLSSRA
jgi:hypothetical protein